MVEIDFTKAPDNYPFHHLKKEFEKQVYQYYFNICKGNHVEMAKLMGVSRGTVTSKVYMYDIVENRGDE